MLKSLTTDNLVETLKRRAQLPTDSSTFSKADYIEILNEEMVHVVKFLMSSHEEYMVYSVDKTVSSESFPLKFRIPSRATGNKLRGAAYVASDNNLYEMTRIDIGDLPYFDGNYPSYSNNYAYYVQADQLIIPTTVPNGVTLRMYFYMRPSSLVEDKFAAVVTGINSDTGVIQVDKIPSSFSSGQTFDFTESNVPNKLLEFDKVGTVNSVSNTITFSADDLPAELTVGDYITLAGESIVPQIPVELHPILAQQSALHCLHSIGDMEAAQLQEVKLKQMQTSVIDLIDNRVEDAPQKINNMHSPLRQATRRYGYRRWRRG